MGSAAIPEPAVSDDARPGSTSSHHRGRPARPALDQARSGPVSRPLARGRSSRLGLGTRPAHREAVPSDPCQAVCWVRTPRTRSLRSRYRDPHQGNGRRPGSGILAHPLSQTARERTTGRCPLLSDRRRRGGGSLLSEAGTADSMVAGRRDRRTPAEPHGPTGSKPIPSHPIWRPAGPGQLTATCGASYLLHPECSSGSTDRTPADSTRAGTRNQVRRTRPAGRTADLAARPDPQNRPGRHKEPGPPNRHRRPQLRRVPGDRARSGRHPAPPRRPVRINWAEGGPRDRAKEWTAMSPTETGRGPALGSGTSAAGHSGRTDHTLPDDQDDGRRLG